MQIGYRYDLIDIFIVQKLSLNFISRNVDMLCISLVIGLVLYYRLFLVSFLLETVPVFEEIVSSKESNANVNVVNSLKQKIDACAAYYRFSIKNQFVPWRQRRDVNA